MIYLYFIADVRKPNDGLDEIYRLMIKWYDFVSKEKLIPNSNQSVKLHQLIFFIDFTR